MTPKWKFFGCFKDKDGDRAMGDKLYASMRSKITNWLDLTNVINLCAKEAVARKLECFAVQNYGECWGTKGACKTFNKHGASDYFYKAVVKVGREWTNCVYHIEE